MKYPQFKPSKLPKISYKIHHSSPEIMPIEQWHTIVTKIPPAKEGKFAIFKREIEAGKRLDMSPVFGYDSALFLEKSPITVLYEGDKDPATDPKGVWMSDSPFEYYGMTQLAARAKPGRVLVGGLGLGILSNLLADREDITEVVVVEISPEVIKLLKPYLHRKVKVVEGDFLKEMWELERKGEEFQTVIADIFKTAEQKELFEDTRDTMTDSFPEARHLFWAFQDEYDEDRVRYWLMGREIMEKREAQK